MLRRVQFEHESSLYTRGSQHMRRRCEKCKLPSAAIPVRLLARLLRYVFA